MSKKGNGEQEWAGVGGDFPTCTQWPFMEGKDLLLIDISRKTRKCWEEANLALPSQGEDVHPTFDFPQPYERGRVVSLGLIWVSCPCLLWCMTLRGTSTLMCTQRLHFSKLCINSPHHCPPRVSTVWLSEVSCRGSTGGQGKLEWFCSDIVWLSWGSWAVGIR